jgi:hypothetical protein
MGLLAKDAKARPLTTWLECTGRMWPRPTPGSDPGISSVHENAVIDPQERYGPSDAG